ncbi:hypothetical protein MICAC_2250003 [Microcystis aeruginosa PCC 9443]|uniref:Uncharacterized protein n=1 Tax=Microcystis aeruginosa PCC 9443 TaxID=1160281 RepID=I4G0X3_MICAE|nr:hypothetical protein MICAC_2250003 [Microcystis aeruginosa PCC 9443]
MVRYAIEWRTLRFMFLFVAIISDKNLNQQSAVTHRLYY